jgi:hypothetical protein
MGSAELEPRVYFYRLITSAVGKHLRRVSTRVSQAPHQTQYALWPRCLCSLLRPRRCGLQSEAHAARCTAIAHGIVRSRPRQHRRPRHHSTPAAGTPVAVGQLSACGRWLRRRAILCRACLCGGHCCCCCCCCCYCCCVKLTAALAVSHGRQEEDSSYQ